MFFPCVDLFRTGVSKLSENLLDCEERSRFLSVLDKGHSSWVSVFSFVNWRKFGLLVYKNVLLSKLIFF